MRWIMGELAGEGSVTVAVGVSDMWQVTRDMWHLTHDTWHMTYDFFVLVLLSAHVERFIVSCMRDFSVSHYWPVKFLYSTIHHGFSGKLLNSFCFIALKNPACRHSVLRYLILFTGLFFSISLTLQDRVELVWASSNLLLKWSWLGIYKFCIF